MGNLSAIVEKRREIRRKKTQEKKEEEWIWGWAGERRVDTDKKEVTLMLIPVKILEQTVKSMISEILVEKVETPKQQHKWHLY